MVSVPSLGRAGVVARRVLKQIRRDRRTLGMMIAMPAIVMLIFGLALSGEVKNVPILIENQDAGYTAQVGPVSVSLEAGADIEASLKGDDRVRIINGSYGDGVKGVDSGEYFAAVRIPPDFSERLYRRMRGENVNATLGVYIDGTKPAIRASILGAVGDSLRGLSGGGGLEVDQVLAFGGAEYSGLDVSIPSVMGFVLTFLVLLISLIIINRESSTGTLQRLYTTPLTAFERLLGYVAALLLLGMMMTGVVLLVGVIVFQATVRGSLALLFVSAFVYALTHVLFAVFLSNFARNELQAVQLAPIIALPSMALSGMLVPVNSLPDLVQPLARIIPLYYGNRVFEGIMLKGYGVSELSGDLLVICGMAAVFLVLATMTVKDRMDA